MGQAIPKTRSNVLTALSRESWWHNASRVIQNHAHINSFRVKNYDLH